LGKPHGIKPRWCWEHLKECIWEHDGNTLKSREKTKNPSPPSFK